MDTDPLKILLCLCSSYCQAYNYNAWLMPSYQQLPIPLLLTERKCTLYTVTAWNKRCRAQQGPVYEAESLECTMLLIRAWSSPKDLSESIRAALLIHPQANEIILPGLGVMVLAPSIQALERRTAIVERLICLAAGERPPLSNNALEAPGEIHTLSAQRRSIPSNGSQGMKKRSMAQGVLSTSNVSTADVEAQTPQHYYQAWLAPVMCMVDPWVS